MLYTDLSFNHYKAFKNADLQALLDENPTQTLKQLADALNLTKSTISERTSTAIGKDPKEKKVGSLLIEGNTHHKVKHHL